MQPAPKGKDLAQVAESCKYVGSPYHRSIPTPAGPPRSRPTASLCPVHLTERPDLVELWLRDAIRSGNTGAWEGGYPRYAWRREGEIIFEARQGSPGSGEYHGYPLERNEGVRGLP